MSVSPVLHAQLVHGTLMRPDSTSPVANAIVVATDVGGAQAARSLTGSRGEFTLRLPSAGHYTIEVLRIGYQPTRRVALDLAEGETRTITIVQSGAPVTLAGMSVRERETCRVSADTGLAVARVWEEARKAMLMSQLDPGDVPLIGEWTEYDRALDSTSRLVRDQSLRTTRAPTTHAFRSVPASVLDTGGYVVAERGATTYHAPDVDVLLSDSFVFGHCFRLDGSRADAGLVGVSFQPNRDRRDMREIRGTLWVDGATAELRTLDFQYTNLPSDVADAAGGHVEFQPLSGGGWIVSRWNLTMPRVERRTRVEGTSGRRTIMTTSGLAVIGVEVAGGEVTRVTRRDSVVFVGNGARVTLQLVARDALVPAAGAIVSIDGTDYSGQADANGRVTIAPVLDGRYRAQASTPLMDSIGMPPLRIELESRRDAHVDSVSLPRAMDLLAFACPRDSLRTGDAMVHGHLGSIVRTPVAVVAHWTGAAAGTFTNEHGDWRICGVPRGEPLIVRAETDSAAAERRVELDASQPFANVELTIDRAPRVNASPLSAPRAMVEFIVTDVAGRSLRDAVLEIEPEGVGPTITLRTNSAGRALVPDAATGRLTIRARHVGFLPGRLIASVERGRNTVPIVLSTVMVPTLDTVRVVGGRRLAGLGRHDEFDSRRINSQSTVSFTRAQIQQRNPVDLWQMLTGIPSLRVVDSGAVTVESNRSRDMNPDLTVKACYIAVMVDGQLRNPLGGPFDLRLLPSPAEVYGVEVFAGPASIPLQYSGTGSQKWCGMIAVWTR